MSRRSGSIFSQLQLLRYCLKYGVDTFLENTFSLPYFSFVNNSAHFE